MCLEAYHLGVQALSYDALDAIECAAADEENMVGVDLYEALLRVLPSSLRRHVDNRAFKQFEQSLLNTFTRHVASDAGIISLARNLVNLVDEDYASFGLFDIVVACLQQSREE